MFKTGFAISRFLARMVLCASTLASLACSQAPPSKPDAAAPHSLPNRQAPPDLRDVRQKYYDANPPALPKDYPARTYSSEQLVVRLVVLANEQTITRSQLEQEFGLVFVDLPGSRHFAGTARGRRPLGSTFSTFRYSGTHPSEGFYLMLSFEDEPQLSKSAPVCIPVAALDAALTGEWRRVERGGDGHYPYTVSYQKGFDKVNVTTILSPSHPGGGVPSSCLKSFTLIRSRSL